MAIPNSIPNLCLRKTNKNTPSSTAPISDDGWLTKGRPVPDTPRAKALPKPRTTTTSSASASASRTSPSISTSVTGPLDLPPPVSSAAQRGNALTLTTTTYSSPPARRHRHHHKSTELAPPPPPRAVTAQRARLPAGQRALHLRRNGERCRCRWRRHRRAAALSPRRPSHAPRTHRRRRPLPLLLVDGHLRRHRPARRQEAGHTDQQPVPGAADRGRHQRQPHHQRLQQAQRAVSPLLERDPAAAELVRGRGGWDDVPHPARRQLHLHPAGEGPDRHLLLLPLPRLPQGRRRLRRRPRPQPPHDPRPLPAPRRRLRPPRRRLVQRQPHRSEEHARRRQGPRLPRRPTHQRPQLERLHFDRPAREDIQVSDLQCRAGDVVEREVPGAHDEAGGGGGVAHDADHLLVSGRAPRPVVLSAAHRRPACLRLRRCRLHAIHHQDHLHHRRPSLRQLRRQGAWPAPRWPNYPNRLVAQPGSLHQMEPDGERAAAEPAGLVPLRTGADDPDHQAGELGGHHQREAEVRGERHVVRERRHAAEDRRLLQDPRRVLRRHHLRQPALRRRRRRRPPPDGRHGGQLQGLRRGGVRELRERGAVLAHRRLRLLGRRDGWREMVVGEQAELQPEGRRFAVHGSGLPQVVDGDLHAAGQRGHVECEVGELGQAVPGSAVLPPRLDAVDVVARRVPHPQERPPLRPRRRPPDQTALMTGRPGQGSGLVMRG